MYVCVRERERKKKRKKEKEKERIVWNRIISLSLPIFLTHSDPREHHLTKKMKGLLFQTSLKRLKATTFEAYEQKGYSLLAEDAIK